MAIQTRTVWKPDGRHAVRRIPGLCFTKAGTLLACWEARDTLSDWARMDILLSRSEDGGETFEEPLVMAQGDAAHATVNNPVCIAGPDGLVHFLYCRDYSVEGGGVWYRRSSDDGRTWSEPVDLSDRTCPALHNAFAFGPGHGIGTPDGTLLVPVWYVEKAAGSELRSHHPAVVSSFFSRDGGETWSLGEVLRGTEDCPDPNETAAAVTSDGGVYFGSRLTGAGYRASAWSGNGTEGFTRLCPARDLPDPTCMGSVAAAEYEGRHVLLSVNCGSVGKRENLVCRASLDDGHTWPISKVVEPGDAGYADLAVLPGGTVFVLYEQRWGAVLRTARFPLEELFR